MKVNQEAKSSLARLLAQENIKVVYQPGQYTASFDPQNRLMNLPLLSDKYDEEYVYEGFLSHEIGHALWTPVDALERDDIKDIPFSTINVIEDIRIEKLARKKYPGIKKTFYQFYSFLMNNDFFSIGEKNVDELGSMDRINIFSKVGIFSGIHLDGTEKVIYEKALQADTFEDVIEIAREIKDMAEEQEVDTEDIFVECDDDSSEEQNSEESDNQQKRESTDSNNDEETDDLEAQTHDNLNANMAEQLTSNINSETIFLGEAYHIDGSKIKDASELFIPYSHVLDENINSIENVVDYDNEKTLYDSFKKKNKHVVDAMVKEFEMKKSADESKRTKTESKGSIDPSLLKDYKITEDIFKKAQYVQEGKSHGIVMFIDLSGSMRIRLKQTIEQVIIMIMFARKVGIPFEVFGFTQKEGTTGHFKISTLENYNNSVACFNEEMYRPIIRQIFSSKMKKNEIEKQMEMIFTFSHNGSISMCGTPLNQTIVAAEKIIEQFKEENDVQICSTIFLSDGISDSIDVVGTTSLNPWFPSSWDMKFNIIFDEKSKKTYKMSDYFIRGSGVMTETAVLMKILQDRVDSTIMTYFIGQRQELTAQHRELPKKKKNTEDIKKELKSGFIEDTMNGFDYYFLIDDKNLIVKDEVVSDNTKDESKIKKEFRSNSKKKKNSRIFASQVLKIIS